MAQNRELTGNARKSVKNATVKASTTGKSYLRVALPTFNPTTGAINKSLTDLQNVHLEGDTYAEGDTLTGTFAMGLRYYSKLADGTTDRPDPFYRWELLEELDVQGEREDQLHSAKITAIKTAAAKAGVKKTAIVDEDDSII